MAGTDLDPYSKIYAAFENRLRSLASIPKDGTTPLIESENSVFTAPTDALWVRLELIHPEPAGRALGDRQPFTTLTGRAIITAFGPRGTGAGAVKALASAIAVHFKVATRIVEGDTYVTCVKTWADGGISGDSWYSVPVNIRFRSHTQVL
jgi:hypothetical protein